MVFIGDIALPYKSAISFKYFPENLSGKGWLGNLEGGIVDNGTEKYLNSVGVFNDIGAIKELTEMFNFHGFTLANNHITDLTDIETTFNYLSKLNISNCGIGKNTIDASRPLIFEDDGFQVVLLNFGWEVIQCEITSKKKGGVNPLTKDHVINSLCDTVLLYPKAKVIPFMHWGYELESEPQPFERELAKKLIDFGAAGVIGSHSHRVGGFEIYNGKPIVYCLGNWLFKQNYYFGNKLSFPDFCNLELAFEWDFVTDEYLFHFFEYNQDRSQLTYLRTEGKDSKTMSLHTPFKGLANDKYKRWYRQNHYHKRKGLPVYYWEDHQIMVRCKNIWNKLRDSLLKIIFRKGK